MARSEDCVTVRLPFDGAPMVAVPDATVPPVGSRGPAWAAPLASIALAASMQRMSAVLPRQDVKFRCVKRAGMGAAKGDVLQAMVIEIAPTYGVVRVE
jgi:hypothetical protein